MVKTRKVIVIESCNHNWVTFTHPEIITSNTYEIENCLLCKLFRIYPKSVEFTRGIKIRQTNNKIIYNK